jgi:intracellular septation protein A
MSVAWWWYPTQRFTIDGLAFAVTARAQTDGLVTRLSMLGVEAATDRTPLMGPESVRNHRLAMTLPDGRRLEVEAGYMGVWTIGIVARLDGQTVHESHPGRAPAYPEKYRDAALQYPSMGEAMKTGWREGGGREALNSGVFAKRNRLPIAVDIACGLLFYVIALFTDLTTAALIGAAIGIGLVVFQRITGIDVTGGLVLFGIVMLLISTGLALALQDQAWIKLRGTITGLIAATLFLGDGLLGGKRLARGMARYLPYDDIDPGRLGIGIGFVALAMAGLNFAVARYASTDVWLFYKTFVDFAIAALLFVGVLSFARAKGPLR